MKLKILQRSCIWFCVKRGLPWQQTCVDLCQVFGNDCFCDKNVRKWWKDFHSGVRTRDTIEDKGRRGWPKRARDAQHVALISALVQSDRRITISQLQTQTDISRRSIHKILKYDLKLSKIAAKFVPRMLTEFDRDRRKNVCRWWINKVQQDGDVLRWIVTGDESWVWVYDPESKRESCQWLERGATRPMKFRQSRSCLKVMIIVFFDRDGIIHVEFTKETITAESYIQTLMALRDSIRLKRPQLWKDHNWILLDDNAPVHTADDTEIFRRQVRMSRGPHPAYSPDLAPCDFFLFPKMTAHLRGTRYGSLARLKEAVNSVLDDLTPADFRSCFDSLQKRWQRCLDADGQYFEGFKTKD